MNETETNGDATVKIEVETDKTQTTETKSETMQATYHMPEEFFCDKSDYKTEGLDKLNLHKIQIILK